jgi:hypothetical protein
VVFVGGNGLDDQFDVGGDAQQVGDDVGCTGQHASLKQDDVGGIALDGGAEIFDGVCLGDDAKVVFQSKDFANAYAIDCL